MNIQKILGDHSAWLRNDPIGVRADLSEANLRGADLYKANLSEAYLPGADLRGAYLRGAYLPGADLPGADLSGADLRGTYLPGADLSGADLRGANLRAAYLPGADLSGADLSEADLRGADLSGADLSGADLSGADLSGADLRGADLRGAKGLPSDAPKGSITGWKKCRGGVLVKLRIPQRAKRSKATTGKCRAEWAYVEEIIGAEEAVSKHAPDFIYQVGVKVTPDSWDVDRWNECSGGIHFFLTREEAEAW